MAQVVVNPSTIQSWPRPQWVFNWGIEIEFIIIFRDLCPMVTKYFRNEIKLKYQNKLFTKYYFTTKKIIKYLIILFFHRVYILSSYQCIDITRNSVLKMKSFIYWSESNSWICFTYISKLKLKDLLVRIKFYWSWTRGPVLVMRTEKQIK